ncbi:MAG: DUF3604 domain-containing protein [Deltaproteobacteria bacterium]|nr:DUF3604 domain-containing protein [Deltaproteobacteria bacterium]
MSVWKRGCLVTVVLFALVVVVFWVVLGGGDLQTDGEITATPLDPAISDAREDAQRAMVEGSEGRVLFGDLHVHSTLSVDAFQWSLPLMGGEGVHPPADACDFARFCSQLDFYSLTDHAEALTPRTWKMIRESIRECNAVDSESAQPDLVAFTGFEWTQIGTTPATHYGHRNVIFKDTGDEQLPARPIAAPGLAAQAMSEMNSITANLSIPFRAFPNQQPYNDVAAHVLEIARLDACPEGVASPELPAACREVAATPDALGRELHGHSARHHLGLLHATRLPLRQATPGETRRPEVAAAHRGLLGTWQFRRVPNLSGCRAERGRTGLSGTHRGI